MRKILFVFIAISFLAIQCKKKGYTAENGGKPSPPVTVPGVDPPASVADCKKCIILAEQLQTRVAIADVASKAIIWEWSPGIPDIKADALKWFSNISDAKLVYNGKYILATASGGGVALVRIADKKTVFYAFAGGNVHSAELLPDGNIVSASSTGNYLTLFKVDTLSFPDHVYAKTIPIDFGHNVVWDHKNQVLWSAAMNQLKSFKYNFNCDFPDLDLLESISIPGTEAHDLFPVHGENALWLTNTTNVYKFDVGTKKFTQAEVIQADIKSVSSGPEGYPIILLKPKVSWWADEVIDAKGNTIFLQNGLKIYKARWLLQNVFSYPVNDVIKQCK
ncbi:DUF6528 family protein [Pedobacter heparinus]|uniref:WD40 repeat domain-containing protein n=1 Tax=Pedobacter heparinus (strain ATCC 13125 / DSM 2366 / CIP 104194 / JCM 7457 / NBRC 12017 / NCIMB 9290 / NRRL B-14731 / HIM 762-3) TaxID=485917 RepID=C6XXS8_PEDHD|nr:DUF6528 family protein [Pedobacter heparinus]ACU04346.1 hypothetical protein Phep_2142 [Pedobacter heparinus DSM 2366]